MARLTLLEFSGSPYLGVFARANEEFVVVPPSVPQSARDELGATLQAEVIVTTIGGSAIVGAVMAANSKGVVVADFADTSELEPLLKRGLSVARLSGRLNAAGNNVLANDRGAIVNPDLSKATVEEIEKALGVPARRATIAALKTVGSAAFVTKKGVLCHPKTTDDEIKVLEEVLGVEADIGTINHGAPYIGAGLVGNSKGCAIGRLTTGPEMNRIEDALGYY